MERRALLRRRRTVGIALALAALSTAGALAGPAVADRVRLHFQVKALFTTGKEQLADRDYRAAAATFDKLSKEVPEGQERAEAIFLLAQARLLGGDALGAIDTWGRYSERYPDSAYASKARFLMADAFAALGREKDAAEIYRERVSFFTGEGYRKKLARLYLDLAEEAYEGQKLGREGDPLDPPRVVRDFARARSMLEKARAIHLTDEQQPAVAHRIAACSAEIGDPARAVAEWKTLLEKWPGHAVAPDATFGMGRAYLRLGAAREAREMLARMEEKFADHALTPPAVELLGESFSPLETGDPEARKKGLAHWDRFKARYPDHEAAPRVFYRYAQALFNAGDYEASATAFAQVETRFPKNDLAPESQLAIARCFLARKEYDRAREAFAAYLGRYPNHGKFVEAQTAIVEAAMQKAEDLFSERKFAESEPVFREFLRQYPVSPLAPRAQLRLGQQHWERAAGKDGPKRDRALVEKAIEEYGVCASKYPQFAEAPAAQLQIAWIYETELGRLADAIREYEVLIQRFPYSGEAGQARQRIGVMKETQLRVETKRAYATNEPFVLHADLRNVPALRFKAYRLDLLEYLRKKHRVAQVEALAIDIVAPDKTWTHEVEGFEPYREFAIDIPLPLDGRGAWVVLCEEDEYRATTLVLRSDVAIVVKQAPGQLLVFAKDEKTGEPAPGVKLVASDGSSIVKEGETGKDGVWLWTSDQVPSQPLRVLGWRGGENDPARDYAFGEVAPGSLVTWGYKTKAYVYTDRPVYRPGQTVKFKGIVRRVEGGEYRTTAGETLVYSVKDPRGVTLLEKEEKTNAFGSFSGEVTVGDEPPLGTYAIVVRFQGTSFQGRFDVEEYKKPEVLVEVEPEKTDFLTGDDVKAKARVRYYFGGAVASAPIRWAAYRRPYAFDAGRYKRYSWFFQKPDGGADEEGYDLELVARGETTADEKGEAEVLFKTEAGAGDQVYTLQVEALDVSRRWVAGAANIFVTERGFFAVLQVDKKVYRPKERVTATVITVDAAHRPVEAKGELVLFRRRTFEGRTGEEAERRLPAGTGKDGRATIPLEVEKAGEYRLAFVGKDRRGGEVEGGVPLFVAGEAEDLAKEAKLVADREVYNRGEKADLLIHSPAANACALLTFEGERVLDYRVLKLDKRSTSLPVEMRDLYSPNIVIKVAIPANHQLYEAQDEVLVLKFLKVAVAPDRPEARPGEEVTFRIEAQDQSGGPAEAELSIAVVDAAIYAIKPDTTPDIKPFFYDQKRELAVGTRSSYEFRYAGVTAQIPKELLAETERRKEEAKYRAEREGRDRRAEAEYAKKVGEPMPPPAPPAAAAPGGPARRGAPAADMAEESPAGGAFLGGKGKNSGDRDGLADAGPAPARLRKTFADTAHWDAHVKTGRDGKASVKVTLPDNLTTWRTTVRGATKDTLVGGAEAEVVATKKLLVRAELPRFATHKDRFAISTIVHNYTGAATDVALEVRGRGIAVKGGVGGDAGRLELKAGEVARRDFEVAPEGPGMAVIEAKALARAESDAVESPLPVLPFGVRVRAARSGSLGDEATWTFEVPADRIPGTERLEVSIAPSLSTALLDSLQDLDIYPYGCIEQTVNRFLPALGVKIALSRAGVPDDALARRTDEAVRRGITRLQDLQHASGGWGWWPESGPSAEVTAYALLALELAADEGYYVDPNVLYRGRQGAVNLLRGVGSAQDSRALLVLALATGDPNRVPEDDLSRAIRALEELSPMGVAMVAMAAKGCGRDGEAARALERLRATAVRDGVAVAWKQGRGHGWFESDLEATAWVLLAFCELGRADDALAEGAVRTLLAGRRGSSWRSTKETGAAVLALAAYIEARGITRTDCTVAVLVDGKALAETALKGGSAGEQRRRLVVEGKDLPPGKHTLEIRKKGTGSLHYTAVVQAVRATDLVKAEGNIVSVDRKYVRYVAPEPAGSRDPKSRPKTRGYSIVQPKSRPTWEQETALTEARSGDKLVVKVIVEAREALAYVIVEDPLPAGCEALAEGAEGGFDRFERRDEKAAFFLSRIEAGRRVVLSYVVRAITPGAFLALPAEVYPMYEPEVFGRSGSARLTVHEAGASLTEKGEKTPDEIYAEVLDLLDAGRHAEAKPPIEKLLKGYDLLVDVKEELYYRLFQCELALKNPGAAVKAYEALVDLNPRRSALPLAEKIGLADSYLAISDPRRARELCRDVVASAFQEDVAVADVYRSLGRELPAQDYAFGLVRLYPDADYVLDGWYRLARRYLDLDRPTTGPSAPKHYDPKRPKKMFDEAFAALKEFIAYHPQSPWCDDAQFYAMQARFQVEDYEPAAIEARKLIKRYGDSEYLDDAYFTLTLALFQKGKYDEALKEGAELLKLRIRIDEKRTTESPFVPQVQHLFAKIYHLRGDYPKAVAHYRLVANQIEDARDALAFFEAKGLEAPEVLAFAPGTPPRLTVRAKNVDSVQLKVYKVDLLILFAKQKSLADVHKVDLTGISPVKLETLKLGLAPYVWHERALDLPFKEKGVYLAVVKAGDLDQSTVAMVTELDLRVQRVGDKVRVYAISRKDGLPVPDVYVTVSDGARIVGRGRTDQRGLFEARGVYGKVFVVAEKEGSFALHRE